MNNTEKAKLVALLAKLAAVFEKTLSEAVQEIYLDNLADFSIEQVERAVSEAIQTLKFFPKIAELRQLVEGTAEDRAAQAWSAFLEAAADGGQSSARFFEPAAAMAMDAVFGGWVQACRLLAAGWVTERGDNEGGCSDEMLAHYQKAFLRQYLAALNLTREVELYRPGLSEMSMREGGGAWAARTPTLIQPVIFIGQRKSVSLRLPFDVARGCLTEDVQRAIAGGWDAVRALAATYQPQIAPAREQKALPAAVEGMATPEEIAALKASIANLRLLPMPKSESAPEPEEAAVVAASAEAITW